MRAVEFLAAPDIVRLSNTGVVSEQLLSPHNSASARVTITRVTVEVGASQPRHAHDNSEQIWVALHGTGLLKLAGKEIRASRLVRLRALRKATYMASRTQARSHLS